MPFKRLSRSTRHSINKNHDVEYFKFQIQFTNYQFLILLSLVSKRTPVQKFFKRPFISFNYLRGLRAVLLCHKLYNSRTCG